jgi:hypothetical protein
VPNYTPVKGAPAPPLPGPDQLEALVLKVEDYLRNTLAESPEATVLNDIMDGVDAVVAAVNPDGVKGSERTALLSAAYAEGPTLGIPMLTVFVMDQPPHPTAWVRWARWAIVQLGGNDPLPNGD